MTDLRTVRYIYMLGIGGIGMSALARYFKQKGVTVEGYDRTLTPLTDQLIAEGIPVTFEIVIPNFEPNSIIIYTPAVKDHSLLEFARQHQIPLLKRAQILGLLSTELRTLAVAGTHGKTTTSSMIAYLLQGAGKQPTAFVGGIMRNYDANLLIGTSDLLVVEADEFDRSFLRLHPSVAVLTSLDADHLDIYGTTEEMQQAYTDFIGQIQPEGLLIVSKHVASKQILTGNLRTLTYGLDAKSAIHTQNLDVQGLKMSFDYVSPGHHIKGLTLNMPGLHNVENALAAITVALTEGVTEAEIHSLLPGYRGVKRRFEVHVDQPEVVYIDDYAHHPEEIKAVLQATRQLLPRHKMVVVFQPHLFSRTRDFYLGFAESLSIADHVLLTPIYPARELSIPHVTSNLIYQHISIDKKHLIDLDSVIDFLTSNLTSPTVILTLGAGDIDTIVTDLTLKLINN